MKIHPLNFFLIIITVLSLAGCSSLPEPTDGTVPTMTFNHIKPIAVDVAAHNVVRHANINNMRSDGFIKPIDMAAESYFRSKLTAAGGQGAFRVEIHEASVRKNHVKAGREMARFLGVFGLDEYMLNVEALLVLERPDIRKSVKMRAGRVVRVSEHSSIANRERDQLVALEELLRALDAEFTRVMHTEFAAYLR